MVNASSNTSLQLRLWPLTWGLCLILSFSMSFSSFATSSAKGDTLTQKKIVTLETTLKTAKDQSRVDTLNELCDLLVDIDIKKAVAYADEAIDLSKKIEYDKGEIDAMNHLGYISIAQNAPDDALLFFRETSTRATELDYDKGLAFSKNGFGILWSNLGDYAKGLDSFDAAEQLFSNLRDQKGIAFVKNNKGTIYESMGLYDKAISEYQAAFSLYKAKDLKEEMAVTANNLGSVNKAMNHFDAALNYYNEALAIHKAIGYDKETATELNNIGDLYSATGDPVQSESYYNQALEIATTLKDEALIANVKVNIGYLYAQNNAFEPAVAVYKEALKTYEVLGDREGKISVLNNLGDTFAKNGDSQKALSYHLAAYQSAEEIGYREGLKISLKQLASDYESLGNYAESSHYLVLYTELIDAIDAEKTAQSFANSEVLFDTEKKSEEIQAQKEEIKARISERNRLLVISGIIATSLLLISGLLIWVAKERKKSEKLLLNILPKKVASELKRSGKTVPERFESCTVYFSDIANFTSTSEHLDPVYLISELNDIFTTFDAIMEKHGCERIKTIGDAYMAVCGLPEPVEDHALRMVRAAHDILIALDARNRESEVQWRIRVGIHTGQIVGGVVGVKKYIYDVFGDTINTASRMESNSEPMRINISRSTFELVQEDFPTTPRPALEVKGKGLQEMFFIEGPIVYSSDQT